MPNYNGPNPMFGFANYWKRRTKDGALVRDLPEWPKAAETMGPAGASIQAGEDYILSCPELEELELDDAERLATLEDLQAEYSLEHAQRARKDPVVVAAMIERECDRIKAMLLQKNEAYGNSALDSVQIFSKLPPAAAINLRIDDKLARIKNGNEGGDEDTVMDLIGYLILRTVERKITDGESGDAT